jgi:hypothetical protein
VISGGKAINDKLTFIGNYSGGEEFGPGGKSWRNLFDLIALYNANEKWSYTGNLDFVEQSGSTLFGIAGQAKYAVTPKSYIAARGEFLIDDGFYGSDFFSVTLGYTHIFTKNFQMKADFRYDFGSKSVFPSDKVGTFKGNQGTFLISAILNYN